MSQVAVLNLFNCMVTDPDVIWGGDYYAPLLERGIVVDFLPTPEQLDIFEKELKPLEGDVLFTREERNKAPLCQLLYKQLLHYFEVYGLNTPGLFDLTVPNGAVVSMRFVKGIAVPELTQKVHDLIYANAPVKDSQSLSTIIKNYAIDYDFGYIQNNEMRIVLYRDGVDRFTDGDDAVRYMCYKATGETLLIKSKEVIAAVGAVEFPSYFFEMHEDILAQVFNRHKKIILAAKNQYNARAINRIARKSKTKHVPIRESISKTLIHKALNHDRYGDFDLPEALKHTSIRDKMKFLNILAKKKVQSPVDSFKIRNGKVFTKEDRPIYQLPVISIVEAEVLRALAYDLAPLKNKTILLDSNVDYGLPVSRKQTLGRLPYGTSVRVDSNEISSGIYWENAWGAHDLDLSTIDTKGRRVGWGQSSGYMAEDVVFSGDVTDATNGAMEFMTSRDVDYGLFVNIFSGIPGSKMELVVGGNRQTKDRWMDEPLIREKHTLDSRECVIGFVKGKTFVVHAGRLTSNCRSTGTPPILVDGQADFWTLGSLFKSLNIQFDVDHQDGLVYDHDLTYESFSYDKLEEVFQDTKIVP